MNRITKVSNTFIDFIIKFEGMKLTPYLCPAKVPTIGVGCTYYENGERVKLTDAPITKERAIELLKNTLGTYERFVDANTRDDINQNQFDALVDFAYNCGNGNLKSSTLLKKVNADPNDATISAEFMKWTRANGKVLKGLVNRRVAEIELYFKK